MDIGIQQIVDRIVSSTSGYLVEFLPLFAVVGGLILAMVVVFSLVGFIPGSDNNRNGNREDFDDWV
jgi:hypothetical protein